MKGLFRCAVLGLGCAVFVLMGAQTASAGPIVSHADVNGLGAFEEVATGSVWVKLDAFYGKSYNEMKTAVEAAGFTVATKSQTLSLLASLPLDNNQWADYASIMGSAPNRGIIWGAYAPSVNPSLAGYAFAYDDYVSWTSFDAVVGLDDVPNYPLYPDETDMGIFALIPGPGVATPEPTTIASAVLGGLGLVALRRRNRSAR